MKAAIDYTFSRANWKKSSGKDNAATGDQGAASAKGVEGVAVSVGIEGYARGKKGGWIVLAEWKEIDNEWHRSDVKAFMVDGANIKEDTFYKLTDGQLVEKVIERESK